MPDQLSLFDFDENGELKEDKEEKQVEASPVKETDSDTSLYWLSALDLVNVWARYQAAKKLYINATHDETQHRVWSVVADEKYYGGSLSRLRRRESNLSSQLDEVLAGFERICHLYEVEAVSREWLYDNLKDARDYASYRGKCQRRVADHSAPAVSLKDLGPRQSRK